MTYQRVFKFIPRRCDGCQRYVCQHLGVVADPPPNMRAVVNVVCICGTLNELDLEDLPPPEKPQ